MRVRLIYEIKPLINKTFIKINIFSFCTVNPEMSKLLNFITPTESPQSKCSSISRGTTKDSNTFTQPTSLHDLISSIPDAISIVPQNLMDIKLIDNHYQYLLEFYLKGDDGLIYKEWFHSLQGLQTKHRHQLLGRFERDLIAIESMPG